MFIARFFRRLLAQFIRLLMLNRVVTLGLLGVLIVVFVVIPLMSNAGGLQGGIGQAGLLGNGQAAQAASAGSGDMGQAAVPSNTMQPDPAVQTYVKGMLAYDATTMWTALHPQLKTQFQGQGITLDTLKAQEAQKQTTGIKYDNINYIGGFEGQSGARYYFYVLAMSRTDATGQTQHAETTFAFTVAPDGGGIYNIE